MTKNISKELILQKTLELINEKQGILHLNFREIARVSGCAHTNLYNYFKSFDDLLWEALKKTLDMIFSSVTQEMGKIPKGKKLDHLFSKLTDFYLANKGLYRLMWLEVINENRPDEVNDKIIEHVRVYTGILYETYKDRITEQQAFYILHTIHCYLHGEISIFISGKGLIKKEKPFREYVRKECLKMSKLYVQNSSESDLIQ